MPAAQDLIGQKFGRLVVLAACDARLPVLGNHDVHASAHVHARVGGDKAIAQCHFVARRGREAFHAPHPLGCESTIV